MACRALASCGRRHRFDPIADQAGSTIATAVEDELEAIGGAGLIVALMATGMFNNSH